MKITIPKVIQLPSGSYRCQIRINGKSISITGDDEQIVTAKAIATKYGIIDEQKHPENITVGQAMDEYINSRDGTISPTTLAEYQRMRIKDYNSIIDLRLSQLTETKLQAFVSSLSRTKSPKTVRNVYGLLSSVLNQHGISYNNILLPQKRKYDYAIPSEEDMVKIFRACRGKSIELPVLLALCVGMRMSEIKGLKKSDLHGNILRIRRAVTTVNGKEIEKDPKTYTSARDVFIPQFLCDIINSSDSDGYLVTMKGKSIYQAFVRMCKELGLKEKYRFHDLRHANASIMLDLKIPNKYAITRTGHATEYILTSTYQHTMKKSEDAYSRQINSYFESMFAHESLTE